MYFFFFFYLIERRCSRQQAAHARKWMFSSWIWSCLLGALTACLHVLPAKHLTPLWFLPFNPHPSTVALLFIPDYRLADGLSNRIPHNQSQDFSTTSSHNSSERSGSLSGWCTLQGGRGGGHLPSEPGRSLVLRRPTLWLTDALIAVLICYLHALTSHLRDFREPALSPYNHRVFFWARLVLNAALLWC